MEEIVNDRPETRLEEALRGDPDRKELSSSKHSLLPPESLTEKYIQIKNLDDESYTTQILKPVESLTRPSAWEVVERFADRVLEEIIDGPLVMARIILNDPTRANQPIEMLVVIQNRQVRNGVWLPEHHLRVADWLCSTEKPLPVVTFIDTPGADAGDRANQELQAHSISQLITTFTALSVPSVGIVCGKAYSGGAIPLASTNVLLAFKDAVFNTIQPQGLAAIARSQNLSWQNLAKKIGIGAVELACDGVIEGLIDYSPIQDWGQEYRVKEALCHALRPLLDQAQCGEDLRAARNTTLRSRLRFQEYEQTNPACLPEPKNTPSPSANQRALSAEEQFENWLQHPQPIRYFKRIASQWQQVQDLDRQISKSRQTRIGLTRQTHESKCLERLAFELATECYHQWQHGFNIYLTLFRDTEQQDEKSKTECLQDLIQHSKLKSLVTHHLGFLQMLNLSYELFISELNDIAWEYSRNHELSQCHVERLWQRICNEAESLGVEQKTRLHFLSWLSHMDQEGLLQHHIQRINEWKQLYYPRMNQVGLIIAGYFIGTLLPRLHASYTQGIPFQGAFQPQIIGRQKGFWHRLTQASRNIRIEGVLNEWKTNLRTRPNQWIDLLFEHFAESDHFLGTSDPVRFPGFSARIQEQIRQSAPPCGLITGTGMLKNHSQKIGVFISNIDFQAGAFDMAAAEKLSRLLKIAANEGFPVIGLVSSAGMQTKEGPAALFSMAVANEAISRFTEAGGRVLMIGYGDCTGGAQASFVTHPHADTYYLSGTNLPFAGQIVVPEHLSLQGSLANYLVKHTSGGAENANSRPSMRGLITHPFAREMDAQLASIDPDIAKGECELEVLLTEWLSERTSSEAANDPAISETIYGPIQSVLIHARGCTALRLVQAVHALNKNLVLVQSDPDMHSSVVKQLRASDRVVCLGGHSSEESYLNAESVLRVAQLEDVDALHPGIGFLSENAAFATACQNQNLNFIGPSDSAIAQMGDKAQAISCAKLAGVSVIPGSHGKLKSLKHAQELVNEIGFPVLIKASHGGGGKGIGIVSHLNELEPTYLRVKQEAIGAFGSGELYLERLLEAVRHIEVQILRDRYGNFRMMGIRDCSLQRNRQKIIEESGEYVLSNDQIDTLSSQSEALSEHINYVGAGTLEFLYDLKRDCFYFMEMNTRLQVEHIVTEMTAGVDLVAEQFSIAEGKTITHIPEMTEQNGHAIEVRINAESVQVERDSSGLSTLSVSPSTGTIRKSYFPEHDFCRLLSIADEGREITPYYDNLVAQLVVHGANRNEAISRMKKVLSEVVIEGINTNLPLLRALMNTEAFCLGEVSTRYVEEWAKDLSPRLIDALNSATDQPGDQTYIEKQGTEWILKAPSSGVLWASPSPDVLPFVKKGDVITREDTLCLIEVMKMFRPITLAQFLPECNSRFEVLHCQFSDGQYQQEGDILLGLKRLPD